MEEKILTILLDMQVDIKDLKKRVINIAENEIPSMKASIKNIEENEIDDWFYREYFQLIVLDQFHLWTIILTIDRSQ